MVMNLYLDFICLQHQQQQYCSFATFIAIWCKMSKPNMNKIVIKVVNYLKIAWMDKPFSNWKLLPERESFPSGNWRSPLPSGADRSRAKSSFNDLWKSEENFLLWKCRSSEGWKIGNPPLIMTMIRRADTTFCKRCYGNKSMHEQHIRLRMYACALENLKSCYFCCARFSVTCIFKRIQTKYFSS